jgi:putative ABC transport system permease protein
MLALAELWYRRGQFALIAVIVALVAYLALMMNGLGAGLLDLAGSAVKQFDAEALVFAERSRLGIPQSELSSGTVDAVRQAPGVTAVAPAGYVAVQPLGEREQNTAAFVGIESGSIAEPPVVAGRSLQPGERGVVLADRRYLDRSGDRLGDRVAVITRLGTQEFEIVGIVDRGAIFFQPVLYGSIPDWQRLRYGGEGADLPAASFLLVSGDGDASSVARAVQENVSGVQAATRSETFEAIPGVQPQRGTANSILGFGLVIGALVVGAFFYVLTIQKIGQIGVLKAVGATSWFVSRQLLIQVALIIAMGIAVAVPLAVLTNELVLKRSQIPILLTANGTLLTAALLMAAGLVSAAFSARRITQVDPLIALGQQQ